MPNTPHRHAVLLDGLHTSHPYLLTVDGQRRLAWMSDELDRLCDGADDRIGRPLEQLLTSAEPFDAVWPTLFDRRRLACERFDLIRASGTRIPIEAGALQLERGEDTIVVILRPICERTDLELQFHDSMDPLRAILDSSPDTVLAMDSNGFVTYANPRAEHLYGYPPSEIVGKPAALLARYDLTL
ncbi:MAG: PAS domain-containing protein, partial [Deltaproteobacteria bacterium]